MWVCIVLIEQQIFVKCQKIAVGYAAIGHGSDHSATICSLKVGLDSLIIFAVAANKTCNQSRDLQMLFLANEFVPEHQALEAQAAHSQGVDGLLTFVGESQRIGIPAKFQAFQVGCALSDIFHQMVDEDLPYFLKIPPVVKKRE